MGYGKKRIDALGFSERWQYRVIEDHQLWSKFGIPHGMDFATDLPAPMYQAHLAIMEGQRKKQDDRRKEMES